MTPLTVSNIADVLKMSWLKPLPTASDQTPPLPRAVLRRPPRPM